MSSANNNKKTKKTKLSLFRLLLFVLSFLVLSRIVYAAFSDHTKTEIVRYGKIELSEKSTGYVIRSENIIQSPTSGKVVKYVPEGTRTKRGVNVLSVVKDDTFKENTDKVKKIDEEIGKIEQNSNNSLFQNDIKKIDNQISDNIKEVSKVTETGDVNYLSKIKGKITNLIDKKSKISGEESFAASNIEEKNKQKEIFSQIADASKVDIPTTSSGIISFTFDKYEQILSPENIKNLNSENLEKISVDENPTTAETVSSGEPVVKIIDNFEWFIAVVLDTKNISPLKVGDQAILVLNEKDEVHSSVVNIKDEKNGKSVITFRLTSNLEYYFNKRKIDVSIVKRSYQGLQIPTSSLVIQENKRGVYIVSKGIVKFKEIELVGFNDEHAIVYANNELTSKKGLSPYDIIITTPKYVKNGQIAY